MKKNIIIASVFGLLVCQGVNAMLGKRTADAAGMNSYFWDNLAAMNQGDVDEEALLQLEQPQLKRHNAVRNSWDNLAAMRHEKNKADDYSMGSHSINVDFSGKPGLKSGFFNPPWKD
jgi:hypothetical protein